MAQIAIPAAIAAIELGYLAYAGLVVFLIPAGVKAIEKVAELLNSVNKN
jgi:hypothetical protein